MTLGIVMLVHTALDRAEQVIRHWVASDCPVVVHVDTSVSRSAYAAFAARLGDLRDVRFCARHRCEWGTWGIVAASQAASTLMLASFPQVRHIYLASGACLPLRPVRHLRRYLDARPDTDFIESATTADVLWTVNGLDAERFTLRFPFSWRRNRTAFDRYVAFQRRCGLRRRIPGGIVPHMGSQWWCLTRRSLSAILQSPDRTAHDRYFRKVWIPDESYYQTLVRRYAQRIESRSLTLSKFDFQGKPHVFYDDHLQLLRRSDCFVARKIWPQADLLYQTFLQDPAATFPKAEPAPAGIDRIFAHAVERRTRGRPGLVMQSRFPREHDGSRLTAAPYSVFEGFSEVFEGFEQWLSHATGARVHGHLFAPDRVAFADGQTSFDGALSDSAALRDYNPRMFLTNLLWNASGERQCFQFGPADNQAISWDMAKDPNAQISVISGAWALPLFRSNAHFDLLRRKAAELQKIETAHLGILRSRYAKARIRIWTLAAFLETPMEALQTVIGEFASRSATDMGIGPSMVDLTGFGQFLVALRNQGMHPHLVGEFASDSSTGVAPSHQRKPYLVKQ